MQAYVLGVAKSGPKLKKGEFGSGGYELDTGVDGAGRLRHIATTTSTQGSAQMLAGLLREPVVDRTGVPNGPYAITLDWSIPID